MRLFPNIAPQPRGNIIHAITIGTLLGLSPLAQAAETSIDFNRDIRPILAENCFQCHGPDAATRKAKLRLDTEAGAQADLGGQAAIVPHHPDQSLLLTRINSADADERMPPPESKKRLTPEQKHLLYTWVQAGAPWAQHWAFKAPVKAPLPELPDHVTTDNEIDAFVLKRVIDAGLQPAPEASKQTLIRRVALDLTGLPPTPEEVREFLADNRPDAYERLVDHFLKSPRYGEHMAWHWLEAARYADTDGYQNDGPRDMWRWRDWVIDAFNQNLPFDQFTIEQLAGDLLPHPTTDQIIATGFNRNHRYNSESGLVFEEFLLENAVDRVDTTSTVWMGLTIGCARCHDHKYDPVSQAEYYQLVAYFNNVPESGRAIKFGNSEPWIKAPTRAQQRQLSALKDKIDAAQAALDRAMPQITHEQSVWEKRLSQTPLDGVLLPQGLSHHYADDTPIGTDGKKGHTLEQIPNLICNGRFSIAFTMSSANTSGGAILSNEQKSSGRNGILVELTDQGKLRFRIISRWIAGVATLETVETLPAGQPIHVVVTNDGTQRAQGMRIYLNGKRAQTRTLQNSNSNKSGEKFGGVMQVGFSHHRPAWRGTVADLRFYNKRTLEPDEIRLLAETTPLESILAKPIKERTSPQAAKLTRYFLDHAAPQNLQQLLRAVIKARADYITHYDALPTTMVMEEGPEPKPTHVRIRGVYHQKGDQVQRGVPGIFPQPESASPKNRLGFAQWLVSRDHPLTARVQVNRYWQQFFGRGLVTTPEDFGAQGHSPSHPQLLDWLAVEFMESGWDIQSLLKKIVTSATYKQRSTITDSHLTLDPENRWLSRAPRLRLRGNVLRDQALAVSGLLVEHQGGPSVKPYQPARLWAEASNFKYNIGTGSDLYRRSLYTYWKRTLAPPSMALLDTADREWCSVRPKETNTPLQALTLLNEPAFFEAAIHLAQRFIDHPVADTSAKIAFAFQAVTARVPTANEGRILANAYETYHRTFANDPKAAEAILKPEAGSPVSTKDPIKLATAVALANVLFNLEEVTTRE